jgi:hypothetical protein
VVTYTIKDSGGTIAAGSLGEVANLFRQVQYLVLRAQRYSSYDLVDLRLSAINLYAGHETQVESFEEGDGTAVGAGEGAIDGAVLEGCYSDAVSCISVHWTGWWPLLHIQWTNQDNGFHIAVDLLGRTQIDLAFFDYIDNDTIDELENWLILDFLFIVNLSLFAWMTVALEKSPFAGPLALLFFIAWMAVLGFLLFWPLVLIDYLLSTGARTPGWAQAAFLILAVTCFIAAIGLSFSSISDPTTLGVATSAGESLQPAKAAASVTLICRVFMFALAVYYLLVAANMPAFLPSLR